MIKIRPALNLAALVLVFAASVVGQDKAANSVRQAEDSWVAAIKSKDKTELEAILSNDLVYTHSTGLVENRDQYIASLTSGSQKYDGVSYDAPSIRVYDSTAVVATKVTMTGSTKGTPFNNQLRLLHVWVKQSGKWMLVAHQTTRLP